MNPVIRRFDELSRHDVKLAGGKGASLGELTRAGIPAEAVARQITTYTVYYSYHAKKPRKITED